MKRCCERALQTVQRGEPPLTKAHRLPKLPGPAQPLRPRGGAGEGDLWQHEDAHRSPPQLAMGPPRGGRCHGDVPSRLLCLAGHSPDYRSSPLGVPQWPHQSSIQLLMAPQIMVSGSRDQASHRAPGCASNLLKIFSLSLSAPLPPTCLLPLSPLSKKKKKGKFSLRAGSGWGGTRRSLTGVEELSVQRRSSYA